MRSARTVDRQPGQGDEGLALLTVQDVGRTRALTSEGYLLCKDVPLARTGWMVYGPGEVPVSVGPDNIVHIYRGPDELFAADTIASFNGKPVSDEHPESKYVSPATWQRLARGVCLNVRRPGPGDEPDCLYGDLLITDKDLVGQVQAGKVEVSLGYEAEYEETEPGRGRQFGLVGNHVALVKRGRCGPRCAIGDHDPTVKEPTMGQRVIVKGATPRPRARIDAGAVRTAMADAAEEVIESMGLDPNAGGDPPGDAGVGGGDDGATHIHIHAGGAGAPAAADPGPAGDLGGAPAGGGDLETRVAALESGVQEILTVLHGLAGGGAPAAAAPAAPPAGKTGDDMDGTPVDEQDPDDMPPADDKTKTGDSAALATAWTAMLATAEILVPGFKAPTFDAKAVRTATVDRMCQTRRKCLDQLSATNDGAALLADVAGKDVDTLSMSCAEVAQAFTAAGAARAALNRRASTADASRVPTPAAKPGDGKPAIRSINDLNKLHQQHYASGH